MSVLSRFRVLFPWRLTACTIKRPVIKEPFHPFIEGESKTQRRRRLRRERKEKQAAADNRVRYKEDLTAHVRLSADEFLKQSKELHRLGFYGAAGATSRMALELHLRGVCELLPYVTVSHRAGLGMTQK